jgi:4-hydroxythreonine-4-phosphate dehydrogenase
VKKIILTIGDLNGIGPEIVAQFLTTQSFLTSVSIQVVGAVSKLVQVAESLKITLPENNVEYLNTETNQVGETSYLALEHAVNTMVLGQADALVTGPISKLALKESGLNFSGHTEILETLACDLYRNNYVAEMLFQYQKFQMLLLTRHIPLIQVESALTKARVTQGLKTLKEFLEKQNLSNQNQQVAVMGLNPHAGEVGGDTESKILLPMIQQLNSEALNIVFNGPYAADALMRGLNVRQPDYAAYVACYHDQGLIPMKLLAGLNAVNITIGLPFIRTSVSHGTAPDIVGQNVANPQSLHAAFQSAINLLNVENNKKVAFTV